MHRKDLPIRVPQEIPSDPARSDLRALGRGLIFYGVEVGSAAQDVVIFQLVHREVLRAALDGGVAAGAEKARNLKQPRYMLLVVPAIEIGLELGVDIAPHHQQPGPTCFAHRHLLECETSSTPASVSTLASV